MSGAFDKGESSSTATNTVNIPDFLRPFINQATGIGGGALQRLRNLTGMDSVAGFSPDQLAAFERVRDISGRVVPASTDILFDAARGQGLSFLPGAARNELGEAIDGEFLPAASRQALEGLTLNGGVPFTDALQATAGGDFLFGGEGFDQAVRAAVRAAQPGILSTFGSAGVGGGTGALAQTAIGTAATDAFARQFAQERQNQLGASETLGRLGLAGRGQQIDAAGLLSSINQGEAGLGLNAAGLLSSLSDAERARQLESAAMLPGHAFAGVDPLLNIGGLQQGLEQRRLSAPFDRQLQLLAAALGIPSAFSPLFGSTQTGESESSGFTLGFG